MRWAEMIRQEQVAFVRTHPEMTYAAIAKELETTPGCVVGVASRAGIRRPVVATTEKSVRLSPATHAALMLEAREYGLSCEAYICLAITITQEQRQDAAAV